MVFAFTLACILCLEMSAGSHCVRHGPGCLQSASKGVNCTLIFVLCSVAHSVPQGVRPLPHGCNTVPGEGGGILLPEIFAVLLGTLLCHQVCNQSFRVSRIFCRATGACCVQRFLVCTKMSAVQGGVCSSSRCLYTASRCL
jgi:hypothetical protein